MNLSDLEFEDRKPKKIRPGIYQVEGVLPGNTHIAIGIDPGRNFGLTVIEKSLVQVTYGKLDMTKTPGERGMVAYDFTYDFLHGKGFENCDAIVEGAAYLKFHGQVPLEELRFGFYIALRHLNIAARIVPPASIRKAVFGVAKGKEQVLDTWPWLNGNGADSLAMALAVLVGKENKLTM